MRVMRIFIRSENCRCALASNPRSRGRHCRFVACVCVYVSRSRTRNRVHRVSYLALAEVRFESLKHRATIVQFTSVKEDTLVRLNDDGVFRSRYQ